MSKFIVRLATYHNGGFKEGVSLTVYDELARWEKYSPSYFITILLANTRKVCLRLQRTRVQPALQMVPGALHQALLALPLQ
jgi:hypothetical protein